jgi:hypothetical protein
MIRLASALTAVVLSMAATAAPAAQFGRIHDHPAVTSSSYPGGVHVSTCHSVCVKTVSHGMASAAQCIEWKTVC